MTFIVDGTNGLTFNNSTTQASAGVVLQVVNATYSTSTSTTSATYVTTGLTATITPKFATSKVLILVQDAVQNSSSANGCQFTVFRGTTSGADLGTTGQGFGNWASAAGALYGVLNVSIIDSPATTSATTYTFAMAARAGTTAIAQSGNAISTIILMEIAG
jgi:hypothetical protein